MTAILIILGILAVIFILLICPLSFTIKYDDESEIKIRYLFMNFKIFPPKEKDTEKKEKISRKKEQTPQKNQKEKNTIFDLLKKNSISGLIELLRKICRIFIDSISSITKHIVISKLDVNIIVVGEDAADTAMKFGYVCSAVYPMISIIDNHVKKCRHTENIIAGFNDPETKINFLLKARVKPLFLISYGGSALLRFIKAIAK